MSQTKKPSYVSLELDWMEKKVKQLQAAIDAYDLENLKDRVDYKQTKTGGVMPMVIASIEDQMKAVAMIMEKLPKMLQALDELRQKEEEKIAARGNKQIQGQAQGWLKNRS